MSKKLVVRNFKMLSYLPHKEIMKSIELYGNVLAPAVRQHVGVKEKV